MKRHIVVVGVAYLYFPKEVKGPRLTRVFKHATRFQVKEIAAKALEDWLDRSGHLAKDVDCEIIEEMS